MKTDHELLWDVSRELEWEPSINSTEIRADVKDGIVTLTGSVDSYPEEWEAVRATKRVSGVKGVADRIEVRLLASGERPDADIAHTALATLDWSALVPADRLKVTVDSGRLTLEGEVDWQYQKVAAEQVVHHLIGVKSVTNLIQIQPKVSPTEVKEKIGAALSRSAEVEARGITVDTQNGKVILRGRVRSLAEREAVERGAWAAPGVAEVENHIEVVP